MPSGSAERCQERCPESGDDVNGKGFAEIAAKVAYATFQSCNKAFSVPEDNGKRRKRFELVTYLTEIFYG